ncbi:35297_t:CDS:1, partial [Racocetra persica]
KEREKEMVSVEDDSDLQEILPVGFSSEIGLGNNSSEVSFQGLESSLGRLPVETLKVFCSGEGLSETGTKKDLIERLAGRLVGKVKGKGRMEGGGQDKSALDERSGVSLEGVAFEKGLGKRMEAGEGGFRAWKWATPDLQYLAVERSLEKSASIKR